MEKMHKLNHWCMKAAVKYFPSLTGCDTEHLVMQQETEEESKKQPSADMSYKYEEFHSRPFITPDSEIPENLLHLSYP